MEDCRSEPTAWGKNLNAMDLNTLTWERQVIRRLQHATTREELVSLLDDDDVNTRIVVAMLLGREGESLTPNERNAAINGLLLLLADPACNEYEYGSWQGDEETVIYVSATAAEALAKLGYAKDVGEVFSKAQSQSIQVIEAENP